MNFSLPFIRRPIGTTLLAIGLLLVGGVAYSLLLAADAAGALLAGVLLESGALLAAKPRTAIILAILWCCALMGFSLATVYPLALALLFTAGFFELAFNAMAQTLVQLNAPATIRGRLPSVTITIRGK